LEVGRARADAVEPLEAVADARSALRDREYRSEPKNPPMLLVADSVVAEVAAGDG